MPDWMQFSSRPDWTLGCWVLNILLKAWLGIMLETARSRARWDPCFQVSIKPIIVFHRFYAYESLGSEISFCYFKLFKIPGKWRDWKQKVKQRHQLFKYRPKGRKKRTWSHVSCLYNTVLMGEISEEEKKHNETSYKKIWFVSKEPSRVLACSNQISRTIILDWHYWLWTSHLAQNSWDFPHSKKYATPFEDFSSKQLYIKPTLPSLAYSMFIHWTSAQRRKMH